MKSIIKTLLFGMFLFVAVDVNAQEASGITEYAEVAIAYSVESGKYMYSIIVLYSDSENEEFPTGLKQMKATSTEIRNVVLKKVGEKVKEGWAVYAVDKDTYYLRRKKK